MGEKKKLKTIKKTYKLYRKANQIGFFKYYFGKIKNIFKYIYNIIKYYLCPQPPFNALGTHIITGYPGSGKTLTMNKIINDVDNKKYFFLSNIDEFNQKNVYSFKLSDYFDDNKQIKRFPTKIGKKKIYGIILDEINLSFNRRINKTNAYNNLFVGLVEFIVSHRHQKIPRIYFIGQKLELQDTQLISLFKYQHDIIKTKKRFRYWKYYKDYAEKIPVKLKILTRIKDINDQFIEMNKCKIKIKWRDLLSYDTYALGKIYNILPIGDIKKH